MVKYYLSVFHPEAVPKWKNHLQFQTPYCYAEHVHQYHMGVPLSRIQLLLEEY